MERGQVINKEELASRTEGKSEGGSHLQPRGLLRGGGKEGGYRNELPSEQRFISLPEKEKLLYSLPSPPRCVRKALR